MAKRRKFLVPPEFEMWGHEMGLPEPRRRGQGDNKLPLWRSELFVRPGCDCRFEFGDLGYSQEKCHLVVEWETASGVANWAKHLTHIAEAQGQEVSVLHVHQRADARSTPKTWYLATRKLQDWLTKHLRDSVSPRFDGRSLRRPHERAEAKRLFRLWGSWIRTGQRNRPWCSFRLSGGWHPGELEHPQGGAHTLVKGWRLHVKAAVLSSRGRPSVWPGPHVRMLGPTCAQCCSLPDSYLEHEQLCVRGAACGRTTPTHQRSQHRAAGSQRDLPDCFGRERQSA